MKISKNVMATLCLAGFGAHAGVVSFAVSSGPTASAMEKKATFEVVVPEKPGEWAKAGSEEFAAYPGLIVKSASGDCLVGDGARVPVGYEVSIRKALEADAYEIAWSYRMVGSIKSVKVDGCESLGELALPSIEERRGALEARIKAGGKVEVGAFDFDLDAKRSSGPSKSRTMYRIEAERLR